MRSTVKRLANVLAIVLISPLGILVRLMARFDGRDQWFQFGSHLVSIVPGLPGDYVRRGFYWWVLGCYEVSIGFGSIFAQRDSQIGSGTYIGMFCNIGSSKIGKDVLIGSNVMIASPKMHRFDRLDIPIKDQGGEIQKISIGDGAWLGNGCIVLSDIAEGVVVAAGSIVTGRCEVNGVYAGSPARLIRYRGNDEAAVQMDRDTNRDGS